MTSHNIGVNAEHRALQFLQAKGFTLISNRYKTPHGEIDLLMKDADTLVAVEVKFRKKIIDCHYCISEKQRQRIQDTLLFYVQHNLAIEQDLRCDVVLLSEDSTIVHYMNAW
jgi:putative endonuclease